MKGELVGLFDKEDSSAQKPLIVFDIANNHNGDVNHGLRIIHEISEVVEEFKDDFIFGFKFQYRHLDSFIHQDYKDNRDIKFVKRFSETRLKEEEFRLMKEEIDKLGFISICTPFDEESADLIEKNGFDIIKIASCSFTDWPLLERIVKSDKLIIASTAGATLEEIDRFVTFFLNRNKKFCLMHCMAEYPTEKQNLQLNQISLLKERYPGINIGYSTHESPDNFDSVKIAVGKGALIFEKHVAIGENRNSYSATPEQIKNWLQAAKDAFKMSGKKGNRVEMTEKEKQELNALRRAVFANRGIKKGEKIETLNIFYAIPSSENQILANDISKYIQYYAEKDIGKNKPIFFSDVRLINNREQIRKIVYDEIIGMISKADLPLPKVIDLEISHHYGIEKFHEFGCVMINVINREYCKKFIILLKGQKNPIHMHKLKEESFVVVYGDVSVSIEGEEKEYKKGDIILVERDKKHSFNSKEGGVIEEISTTHYKNDSYYEDLEITKNPERKTYIKLRLDN